MDTKEVKEVKEYKETKQTTNCSLGLNYHLALHLTGKNARDCTMLDLSNLEAYLKAINAIRWVACIEPATHDHLHCVYELSERRPNIKRDILNAIQINTKQFPNNICYNKRLKVGQTFGMLAGGYLRKGYKYINTMGVNHVELDEGKEQYDKLVARKSIRVSKHNLITYLVQEMKELAVLDWREAFDSMLRDTKYNMYYIAKVFTESEIDAYVHFATKDPCSNDSNMRSHMFKKEKEFY